MSADVFDQPLTSPFSSIRHWPWSLLKTLLARASMVPCSFGFLPSSWAVFLLFFASLFVCFHISLVVLNSIKYQSSLTLGPKPSSFLFLYILVCSLAYSPGFGGHLYVDGTHKYISHLSSCFLIFLSVFLKAPQSQHIQNHSHGLPTPPNLAFSQCSLSWWRAPPLLSSASHLGILSHGHFSLTGPFLTVVVTSAWLPHCLNISNL